jgi:hypothetical protein
VAVVCDRNRVYVRLVVQSPKQHYQGEQHPRQAPARQNAQAEAEEAHKPQVAAQEQVKAAVESAQHSAVSVKRWQGSSVQPVAAEAVVKKQPRVSKTRQDSRWKRS